ncbi:YqkE family protein [Paenibacillus yanchengensis]|uniref:YqkE family protein n=1 Tax=Paenibacillus yanchengensis TaxID=2035833 RepID=A0ABW4YKD9_9BACL
MKKNKKSKTFNGREQRGHVDEAKQQVSGHTMQDLIDDTMLQKLKLQAKELEAAEQQRVELEQQKKLAAKQAEKKQKENDFAYLLENSDPNWNKYK